MAIPEFENILSQLGHNTAQIVDPEDRNDNYRRKNAVVDRYLFWIAQGLEHQHVKLKTRIQNSIQDRIFLFQFYN